MFLGRPSANGLFQKQIDNGPRRLCPKTDIKTISRFINPASIRERIVRAGDFQGSFSPLRSRGCFEISRGFYSDSHWRGRICSNGNMERFWFRQKSQTCDVVSPDIRHIQVPCGLCEGEPGGHATFFHVAEADLLMVGEISL